MTDRRYSEEEVARIFKQAAEAQQTARRQLPSGEGMTITDLEAILTSATPGVTVHNRRATFPALAAGATAASDAPHFWVEIDPAACATVAVFDLEFRYAGGKVRRDSLSVRIGDETQTAFIDGDFETSAGFTSDPGSTSRGEWVRENPIGVLRDGSATVYVQPEDDTTPDPGDTCWVTGNGNLGGQNNQDNNDVDGGTATLLSPVFGESTILSLTASFDRAYYDNASSGDNFKAEITNDGVDWIILEQRVTSSNGWGNKAFDLMTILQPTATMQLRFSATDGSTDSTVEAAIDEVHVDGLWVDCQDFTPPAAQAPNPVGDTLTVSKVGAHAGFDWQASPIDGGHDAATLYRVERSTVVNGTFAVAGSSTTTTWHDVDASTLPGVHYYLVKAENSGGTE